MSAKHGQFEQLPIEEPSLTLEEAKHSRSFLTVTRAHFWGLDIRDYHDITSRMEDLADPTLLRSDVMSRSLRDDSTVRYEQDSGYRTAVALNPNEYRLILRSSDPRYLGGAVTAATRSGKASMLPVDRLEERAHKDHVTALVNKHSGMKEYVEGHLASEVKLLDRVSESAQYYWLGREKTLNIRADVTHVLESPLKNMLTVLGIQRGWDGTKANLARRSIEKRLFFTAPDQARMAEWSSMLALLTEYNQQRQVAFRERMGRIKGYLQQTAPEVKLSE